MRPTAIPLEIRGGISLVVKYDLPKVGTRVRFSYSALDF